MRPKVVVIVLLLATGLLAVIHFATKSVPPARPAADALPSQSKVDSAVSNSFGLPGAAKAGMVASPPEIAQAPVSPVVPAAQDPAAHAKYVKQRRNELMALAMNNDVQSRDTILATVKNDPDRQVRAAALEAAIQFDDRSVVPPLKDIADQTTDPDEKQSILDAIDYINLPSLTEYQAANPNTSLTPGVRKVPPRTPNTSAQAPAPAPATGNQ